MTTNEMYEAAANLFDGGWKSTDLEEIKKEYTLTDNEAATICGYLSTIESEYVIFKGNEIKYEILENLMDYDICEKLHHLYAPCSNQYFLDKYLEAHYKKYKEDFEI
jgi:hypothetical protein